MNKCVCLALSLVLLSCRKRVRFSHRILCPWATRSTPIKCFRLSERTGWPRQCHWLQPPASPRESVGLFLLLPHPLSACWFAWMLLPPGWMIFFPFAIWAWTNGSVGVASILFQYVFCLFQYESLCEWIPIGRPNKLAVYILCARAWRKTSRLDCFVVQCVELL